MERPLAASRLKPQAAPVMWTHLSIGGHPADVFEPENPRFVLVFLSDLDGVRPRGNPVWTSLLAANRCACVCPTGAEAWWLDRVWPPFDPARSPEQYLLDDVIPAVTARYRLPAGAVAVAGVGAGGQGALRLGFRHPDRVRVVAGLGSILDFHEAYGHGTALDDLYPSREHCRQDTAVLQIGGHAWPPYVWFACDPDSPWFRGNDRLHEKLTAMGVPHTTDFTSRTGGHSWTYYDSLAPALVRFAVEALEKEARRLV
jgi:pimeloyl-ACP methyl ester carboxylesterase